MSDGHRLYRDDSRKLVRAAVAEVPARIVPHDVPMCGFYPADDYLAAINALPGAGIGLSANAAATSGKLVLNFSKLTQDPPIDGPTRRMLMNAWFSKAGVPTLGSVNQGAGTPVLGALVSIAGNAGIPVLGRAQWLIDHGLTEADVQKLLNPPPAIRWCYVCALFPQVYKEPAIEGAPAIYKNAPGDWNSGAVSASTIYANGRVKFRVQPGQPIVVGLNSGNDPTDPRSQFVGMHFGVDSVSAFTRSAFDSTNDIRIGGSVLDKLNINQPWRFTTYDMKWGESTTHSITLIRRKVTFSIAGKEFGPYQMPEWYFPDTVLTLGAAIFNPGAWVEGVEVYGFSFALGDKGLPALTGSAGRLISQSQGKFPQLDGKAYSRTYSFGSFPRLKARGGRKLAESYGAFMPLASRAAWYAPIQFAAEKLWGYARDASSLPALAGRAGRGTPKTQILGSLPKLTGAARNATRSAGVFPALTALGGRKTGVSVGKLPALATYAPPNYAKARSAGMLPLLAARVFGSGGGTAQSVGVLTKLQGHSYPATRLPPIVLSGVRTALPSLAAVSGGGIRRTQSLGRLPALGGLSFTLRSVRQYSAGFLPSLVGRTGTGSPPSRGDAFLPKLTSTATAGPSTKAYSAGTLPPITGRTGRGTSSSRGNTKLPQLTTTSHGQNQPPTQGGDSIGKLPQLYTDAYSSGPDIAVMYSYLFSWDLVRGDMTLFIVMNSAGTAATGIAATGLVDAALRSATNAGAGMSLSAILAEIMNSEALAGGSEPLFDHAAEVWVLNLANSATSTYTGYDFNSFGLLAGQSFCAREDGVYLLSGNTDAGVPIRASVSYGAQDFGAKTKKHLSRAYVGASSTGTLFLKVTANGQEFIYTARAASAALKQQRFDLGRGLQATYFTFELFNNNGGDFEIDSVSFMAAEFVRRI